MILTPEERDTIARSIAALSCMRRTGETKRSLAKRDAEMARLEALLKDAK